MKTLIRASLLTALAVAGTALATGLPSTGLQAHFRADHAERLTTSSNFPEQGSSISAWESEADVASPITLAGSKETVYPIWQRAAFQRADGMSRPAVRFGNVSGTYSLLESTTDTTLDLGTSTTWFLVMKSRDSNKNKGVFGFKEDPRFGAFFPTENTLRLYNNYSSSTEGNVSVTVNEPTLIDSRSDGSRTTKGVNGSESGASQTTTARSTAGKFYMGRMSSFQNAQSSAEFDCAELAVYNRALKDAETCIVRNALAARWGLTLANPVWTGASAGFCEDLAGIGSSTATGTDHIPGAVEASASSGGLSVSVPDGSLSGANGYLLVAHNGGTLTLSQSGGCNHLARTWRAESTLSSVPAVTFAFDIGALGFLTDGFSGRLYRRSDPTSTFADTGLSGILANGTLSFTFAAGADIGGEYALVADQATIRPCAGASRALQGWFRADAGVSSENGVVSRWRNLGLAGGVGDLSEITGSPTLSTTAFPRPSGSSEASVGFNGSSYLQTASETTWGVSRDCTWFVVFKVPTATPSNVGVFGSASSDYRIGAFFTRTGDLRGYAFAPGTDSGQFCTVASPAVSANTPVLEEFCRSLNNSKYNIELCLDGVHRDGKRPSSLPAASASAFMIGKMTTLNFKGDVAEVRIYNDSLSDTERDIVANHLAARYGVALQGRLLYGGLSNDCALDVVGVGRGAATTSVGDDNVIHVAGAMFTSEDSAGLTLTVDSLDVGDYVLAGHGEKANRWVSAGNGVKRMKRAWHVTKTNASGVDVTLAFDLGAAGIEPMNPDLCPEYMLLRSADGGSWTRVETTLSRVDDIFTATLSAVEYTEGMYTLGVLSHGATIIYIR